MNSQITTVDSGAEFGGSEREMEKNLKMCLKPVWEGKMDGVTKIGIFHPLFCIGMLGKSANYSTGTWPLRSTF